MSTTENPKQFIDVLGVGKTLLQLTVERFGNLVKPENIWVVTNQKYQEIVKKQLPDMPAGNILCGMARRECFLLAYRATAFSRCPDISGW